MSKKYALCIGINDYPGTGMDLHGCVNDAEDWASELAERGYEVRMLLDAQATRTNMVEAIERVVAQAKDGDSVFITFSGHGSYELDADGDEVNGFDQALCPYDVNTAGEALVDDDLYKMFAKRAAGVRLVLFSDSCHSGSVNRAPDPPNLEAIPRFLPPSKWMPAPRLARAENAAGKDRPISTLAAAASKSASDLLLAGCEDGENDFSYDGRFAGRPNGAFTFYALEALKQLPPHATYEQWYAEVRHALPSTRYPQTPQIAGNAAAKQGPILQ